MSRLFWLGVGAAVGIMATRRLNRAARHLTPGGFAEDVGDALHELAGAVGSFGADVRAGMAERERELHRLVDERTGIALDHDDDWAGDGATAGTEHGNGAVRARARGAAN
jgi:hypothetical protein